MSEDMSDIVSKLNNMIKNNEIPDNIKSMMNNFSGMSSNPSTSSNNENSNSSTSTEKTDSAIPNIDIGMIMKMKTIMDSMNKNKNNDPRANLLRSLKPYLKSSRRNKVDQYINLFSMGNVFEIMNSLGGNEKNDV